MKSVFETTFKFPRRHFFWRDKETDLLVEWETTPDANFVGCAHEIPAPRKFPGNLAMQPGI